MDDVLLKGEVFCRLQNILKHYKILLNQIFPTKGSKDLTLLVIRIIEKIIDRYNTYSKNQVILVSNLCNYFEEWCGYLIESRLTNVPWSVIPALEKIFKAITAGHEYAICPIWESNYKIFNKDILEILHEKVLSVQGLIFDADINFDSNVSDLLAEYPSGIFFIFFPKTERLSALHFSLLGHEIGHTFVNNWETDCLSDFAVNTKIGDDFQAIAISEFENQNSQTYDDNDLFAQSFVNRRIQENVIKSRYILGELISDVFGAYIFGDSSLMATYLFAQKSTFDNTQGHQNGYLSWRYRIKFIKEAIDYLYTVKEIDKPDNPWNKTVTDCISEPIVDQNADKYIEKLLNAIEQEKINIFDSIIKYASDQICTEFIDNSEIEEVTKRLEQFIPPNATLDINLNEKPIEFRNIILGTWLYIISNLFDDPEKYRSFSRVINLLSIKGIELSIEQEKFINGIN